MNELKTKQEWLETQVNKLIEGFNKRTVSPARQLAMEMVKRNNLGNDFDIWTYGCAAGYSQVWIYQLAQKFNVKYREFHVLDSWLGLCKEKDGLEIESSWFEGNYSTKTEFFCESLEDAIGLSREFFSRYQFYPNLIPGFYQDSLIKLDVSKLRPAKFLDIDVDLMISTEILLEWMTQNNLLVPGTVMFYDDWLSIDPKKGGEGMAHNEWINKYNITGNLKEYCGGVIFEIKSINSF